MKRSPKPRDLSQMARAIVEESVSGEPGIDPQAEQDPGAVAKGRGAIKGGKARAEKLTADQRSAIARKAAAARWSRG